MSFDTAVMNFEASHSGMTFAVKVRLADMSGTWDENLGTENRYSFPNFL
jgi:hypothetical protein